MPQIVKYFVGGSLSWRCKCQAALLHVVNVSMRGRVRQF